jgi:hypothetical protein
MTFQPGVSGNPKGYNGGRRKGTREAFQAIQNAGYIDPLVNLAKIQHESENEGTRASAAVALLGYCHPKLQAVAVPRYIENPIEVPEFTSVEVAEQFLAKITTLLASGQLDLDFADSLTKTTMGWIQSQYAKQGIDLKAQAQGAADSDTVIRIEGGLPALPGTNITMPPREHLNGSSNGYAALPEPSTLNPSSIDGLHEAIPATPTESISTAAYAAVEGEHHSTGQNRPVEGEHHSTAANAAVVSTAQDPTDGTV